MLEADRLMQLIDDLEVPGESEDGAQAWAGRA